MASYDRQNMLVPIIYSTTRAKPGQVASYNDKLLLPTNTSMRLKHLTFYLCSLLLLNFSLLFEEFFLLYFPLFLLCYIICSTCLTLFIYTGLLLQAHARAIIIDKFAESVAEVVASDALKTVLTQLCELYGVYWLLQRAGDFLMVKLS